MAQGETGGSWRDFLPLSAVFVAGLFLSVSAFMAVHGYYGALDQQQFRRNTTYYSTSFKDDVTRHVTSLGAIRAFVSASRIVTRWEFSVYAHQIMPQNLGFRAILWVPRITRENRKSYEAGLQRDGLYGLRIHELDDRNQAAAAGDRTFYLPVSFVEPFESNDKLVGLDLSRVSRYAELFRSAQQTGHIAASAPALQALTAGASGPTVLLAYPLSQVSGADTAAAGTLQGYALGVLQFQAIIDEAMGSSAAPIQAAIAGQDNRHTAIGIFAPDGQTVPLDRWIDGARFYQLMPFDIAGRHFLLALRSTGQADPVTSWLVPAGASLLVLALTALLAQNMLTTVLRKRLVERAVVARTGQLRAANQTLHDEVQQRRQAEAELRVARDRAEMANRARSSFLASMSHELRTPLNAIIGFSGILSANKEDPHREDYVHEILGSGRHLLALINDILDITQMDAAAGDNGDALIYPADCISAIAVEFQPAAMAAQVSLKTIVPDRLPAIHGDGKRITKALAHLVSNAIKFTPKDGKAVMSAQMRADGTLAIEVMDDGVGMPPEARERIQQSFSQYDGKLGRKYEGVGLGLTYVGKVAELHEAVLEIVSEPGKGTRIRLVFPPGRIVKDRAVA